MHNCYLFFFLLKNENENGLHSEMISTLANFFDVQFLILLFNFLPLQDLFKKKKEKESFVFFLYILFYEIVLFNNS